ncbi:MAG: helix-turn-helix transcriptional regulator [Cyanobacteria bacterium J06635_15]
MTIRFLEQESDYLHPGSPSDSRLFHADSSDQIRVWSPQMGQGYIQTISLREDLSLVIFDYTTNTTLINTLDKETSLEFEFQLAGSAPGQSSLAPHFGLGGLNIRPAQQRQFKVEIFFGPSAFVTYYQLIAERLSPQALNLFHKSVQALHHNQFGHPAASPQAALSQILTTTISSPPNPQNIIDHLLSAPELLGSDHTIQQSMTPEMHQVIHQIFGCPYSGQVRRTYLERKVLDLVALKLNALEQLRSLSYPLNLEDLDGLYEAGNILARQLQNPPSVEALARQVGLNRFKLNEGFHHVYGTTPFRYLRNCRLRLAQQLLVTSKLAIKEVAYRVGYSSCSRFATAFYQKFGLNPKVFQLQINNRWLQQN